MDMKWIAYVHDIAWTAADGTPLGGFAYTYDVVGRITARRHALGTNRFDRAYAYDDLDRLAADGSVSYAYDAAGNRTAKTGDVEGAVAYTRGVGDRLASWTGGAYTYDAAGNVTRIVRDGRPTLDLTWNGQYQLVSVSTNGVFAEGYASDALGRRASTTTWEGTVRHVYDDNWQVIADLDSNGNVLRSYVWGEGIDRLLAVKVGTKSYAALTDVQGTVWGLADGTDVIARWTYDAWGNILSGEVSDPALAAFRYRFQGREFSAVTGLTNFRMRWYDPRTGRWLSKDPIGLNGGMNLYAMCEADCLNHIDPTGTAIWVGTRWGVHQNINVGDPNGKYSSYSFGVDDEMSSAGFRSLWPWNEAGVVYHDNPPSSVDNDLCISTTKEQDEFAKDFLDGLVGNHDIYRIFGPNCRTFSQSMFQNFSRLWKK